MGSNMASPVVKLLGKRWWIPVGALPEGPKLESEGPRAKVGFPTADRGFRAFRALCLALVEFKYCLMLEFCPAKVLDLDCHVQDLSLEVEDLK